MLKGEKIEVKIPHATVKGFHMDEARLPEAIVYAAGAQGLRAACGGSDKLVNRLSEVTLRKMLKRSHISMDEELIVFLQYSFCIKDDEYYTKNKRLTSVTREGDAIDLRTAMVEMTTFTADEILHLCARVIDE